MNWYTLRVISGKEKKVRENILFELDYEGMSDEVENILVPSEKIIEMKDGKKKIKSKTPIDVPKDMFLKCKDCGKLIESRAWKALHHYHHCYIFCGSKYDYQIQ